MDEKKSLLTSSRALLEMAGKSRSQAREAMARLTPEEQVAAVCEAPLEHRGAILGLCPSPEAVIPRIPEAELCFICNHLGHRDAGWILAHASDHQITTCFDLDVWQGLEVDREKLDSWLASLAESGDETLLRSARTIDPELLALHLRSRVDVALKPSGDEDWQPPEAAQTIDGQFYFVARRRADDLAPTLRLLHCLFQNDYWLYFRMMQSVGEELEPELEEWALRWRTGRLEDLGFPPWDTAMRIYGFLRPERLAELPADTRPLEIAVWAVPVWTANLPTVPESSHPLFRAAALLEADERRAFFHSFAWLANSVAVADRKELGDANTLPDTIERAANVASRGLEHLATAHRLSPVETLRRVPLERLFRVGVNLDPAGVRPPMFESQRESGGAEDRSD